MNQSTKHSSDVASQTPPNSALSSLDTPLSPVTHGGLGPSGSGLAPLPPRIIAAVIDFAICAFIGSILTAILPRAIGNVGYLVGISYILFRDALPFLGGQSVGKKLMKIRVVTADGQALTGNWTPALIRSAVFLIPCFVIVELVILYTRQSKPEAGRRLGDDWAKTKVIVEPSPVS